MTAAMIVVVLVATGMLLGGGLLMAVTLSVTGAVTGVGLNALGRRHKQTVAQP